MAKVAIESGLRPFQDALKNAGFIVVELTGMAQSDMEGSHVVVISDDSGADDRGLTGISVPIVSAMGRTPAQVVSEVRRSLGPRE